MRLRNVARGRRWRCFGRRQRLLKGHLRLPRRRIGLPGGLRIGFGRGCRLRGFRGLLLRLRGLGRLALRFGLGGLRGSRCRFRWCWRRSGFRCRRRRRGIGCRCATRRGCSSLSARVRPAERFRLDRNHDRCFGMIVGMQWRDPPQRRCDRDMQPDRQGERRRRHASGLRHAAGQRPAGRRKDAVVGHGTICSTTRADRGPAGTAGPVQPAQRCSLYLKLTGNRNVWLAPGMSPGSGG